MMQGNAQQELMIRAMLRDEDAFLRRAGPRELTQAVLYFRNMAAKANTPQARDFYLDRANQFSIRAVNNGVYGYHPTKMAVGMRH